MDLTLLWLKNVYHTAANNIDETDYYKLKMNSL